jgi:thiol-disulfide isomerase/thioredoxin
VETLLPVLALVATASLVGIFYRLLRGRGHRVIGRQLIDPRRLRATKNGILSTELGKKATLIQFSTQYCGQCPGVRRQLAQLEHRLGGLVHLEVDITDRLNVAARFGINQTPTVFLLNSKGELVYRVGGIPNLTKLNQEIEKLGVK